jgi:hypothetical protein
LQRALGRDLGVVEIRTGADVSRVAGGGLGRDAAGVHAEQQRPIGYLQGFPVGAADADDGERRGHAIGRTVGAADAPGDRADAADVEGERLAVIGVAVREPVLVHPQARVRAHRQQGTVGEADLRAAAFTRTHRLAFVHTRPPAQVAHRAVGRHRLDSAGGHQDAARRRAFLGRCARDADEQQRDEEQRHCPTHGMTGQRRAGR